MPKMKDPHRQACHDLEELGATKHRKDKHGVEYLLPNGYRMHVGFRLTRAGAGQTVRDARARLGVPLAVQKAERVSEIRAARARRAARANAPTKPARRVDLQRVRASTHAAERMALMRDQVGQLDYREVADALQRPESVTWSERFNSWEYTRERVRVVAAIDSRGITTIITLLWSSPELWAENPRPKRRATATA